MKRTKGKHKVKGGVKKRFRLTATGKIKRKRAFHRHILTKKNAKRKRHQVGPTLVSKQDHDRITSLLTGSK